MRIFDPRPQFLEFFTSYFPYFIVIILIFGLAIALLIHRMDYLTRGLFIAIPGIIVAYLLIKLKRTEENVSELLPKINIDRKIFWSFFTILYAISIFLLYNSPFRTLNYFVIISLLFCVVGAQIISKNNSTRIILFQIILININLIYGVTLKYPLFFGSTDILPHIFLTDVVIASGHTIPLDLNYSYASFPLYHIFLAQGAFLTGMTSKTTLFVVTCIPYATLSLFVFLLFRIIIKNEQFSLLTCLIFSLSPVVINYGTYVVTRVFAFIGFVILLYLIYANQNKKRKSEYYFLVFLFIIYLVLVHQVSIIQIIPLLLLLLIFEWLVQDQRIFELRLIILMSIITAGYWIYTASDFFSDLTFSRFYILTSTPDMMTLMKPSIRLQNDWLFLWTNVETSIIVFLILLGIGYVLLKYRSKYLSILGFFTLTTIIFYVPNPFQLFWTNMVIFRADRVMLFVAPFFAFISVWGIYAIFEYLGERKRSIFTGIAIFFLIIFSFSFLSNTISNASDAKDINFDEHSKYFNEQELRAFDQAFRTIPFGSQIVSDYYVNTYFLLHEFSESKSLGLAYYFPQTLNLANQESIQNTYFIFRKNEFFERGLLVESKTLGNLELVSPIEENILKISKIDQNSNKIFENRAEEIFASRDIC